MSKYFPPPDDCNPSPQPDIHALIARGRRAVLRGGLGAGLAGLFAPLAGCATAPPPSRLGFRGVPVSRADTVVVPPGYTVQVIAPWGEPVGLPGAMPPWRGDASASAAEQAQQLGMHHDGMHYFPLDGSSTHGLLAINHEYTDEGLLHRDGMAAWSAEKVRKSQAAHGVSVVEVRLGANGWQLVRPSPYARRHTAATPFELRGPLAGHALVRTAADPAGRTVLGTLNNCAAGRTPWGSFLSGEENWAGYFSGGAAIAADARRYGLGARGWSRWGDFDERFDAMRHPNEFHRFGWIVEIDPYDPAAAPVKRTALGRGAHEGAWVATTRNGRAVVYTGEDSIFEYLYKFVSRDRIAPGGAPANRELLDHGTLYVARFEADGRGRWLPLVHGQGPLTAANGFTDQGEVLVYARRAADLLGATKMDRPEWLAIDATHGDVYCALTNNAARGQPGQPQPDAANPRPRNTAGHILRWRDDNDFDATHFAWSTFVLAGDPAAASPEARGNIRGDAFACPDGLALDARGVLWIQTDMSTSAMGKGDLAGLGHNQMLACDPATGEVRRFLTGPAGCEITGLAFTPDLRTMFLNIQHPGESPSDLSDPAQPTRLSRWPDGAAATRPRSATVVVRRADGGVIGA